MKIKSLLFALCVTLLSCQLLMGDSMTGYVDGDNPNATVNFTSLYATSYSISASPQSGWIFTATFNYPTSNGWYKSGSYSARCEKLIVNDVEIDTLWVDAASIFSVTLSGQMYKPGGTGGSLVDWSVTGTTSASHFSTVLNPQTAVVAKGDSQVFKYLRSDTTDELYGLWWDSSKTPSFTTENYSAIGPTYNFSSNTAGVYTLTAARNGEMAKSASATVNNVEVASVSGAGKTSTNSTGDNFTDAETVYVAKGSNAFNITATPNPGSRKTPQSLLRFNSEWQY